MSSTVTDLPEERERIWLSSYVAGVPADIDLGTYDSINQYFDECIEKYRERIALVSIGTQLSYAGLAEKVEAFAAYLQGIGVKKGDRVAIMLPNLFQYPIALFATLKTGAIVVNVNPLYTARELAHQLKDSGAETIVILENFAHTLEQALPGTAIKRIILTEIGDLLGGKLNLKGRLLSFVVRHVQKMVPPHRLPHAMLTRMRAALGQGARRSFQPVAVSQEDIAFLQYTGGTTGVAKGAMLTNRNIIANLLQAKAWAEGQLTDEIETVLTPLPMYHIYSLTVNCLIFLGLGGRNILIANPRDTKRMTLILRKEQFTGITAVSTLFAAFLENEEFCRRDFRPLKLAMAGGMAMSRTIAEKWQKVTGVGIVEGYGLTECSPIVTINPVDISKPVEFNGSIGVPVPSTYVRMRRDDGSWAAIGEAGELCVHGPQVMLGYWQRPEETARVIDNHGWLATGDVGVMDEHGYIRLIDRKKDMILVSGFNVFPNEVEEVIMSHPDVLEVAAIGVPDEIAGERIKVFVVRRNPELSAEDIIAHCRTGLTGYKIPRIVEFRDELPKSIVGKILRRELREQGNREHQAH
ncbi:acyl-CoA synthetase (long-chain-fatty-acid--CoA ligase) [Sterolibacterium denitrificans]|uniref:Long-chain-fatty-acid--CoA ligase n=1 Tax=Sterolibacterium denitrificans TaxID=157592 RepID=A0A7Z7HRE3_9PROT|nr:AMP-binding protein [Sterolibacterium denitrificans]SMB27319.1 acyl-CoA synthetase (long-chain-fatty-acid--CoA ligase) [Sterolibacterium denitrificans]